MNEQLLNLRFVQEVERRPCLYDFNLPEYSRRDVTENAWNEVGNIVNLTGSQCKEKWKNLRAVFVRHLKAASTKKMKPYYLTDAMLFAVPFIKILNNKTVENSSEVDQEEIIKQESNVEGYSNEYLLPIASPQNNLSHFLTIQESVPNLSPVMSFSNQRQTPSPQSGDTNIRKRENSKYLTVDETDYSNFKKARLETKYNEMDSRKMFLLSLSDDVRSMSDVQMRKFRRKVLGIIDEILEDSNDCPTQNRSQVQETP